MPLQKVFDKKYNIKNQSFNFNKNTHFYKLFETEIKNDFNINNILKISNDIYYKYDNIKNDYHRLEHEYNIYADDILFHKKIIKHQQFYINENIIVKENFEVIIENDF